MSDKKRTRINSKISQLPSDVQDKVDELLQDTSITYETIAAWLIEEGYEISKSAVGRYAVRANKVAKRISENLQQMEAIIKAVEKNPNLDYTKANRILMMDAASRRLATSEDEWGEISLEKIGKLVASISRINLLEEKLDREYKSKLELAFEGMEAELMQVIKGDPKLTGELKGILLKAKERVTND